MIPRGKFFFVFLLGLSLPFCVLSNATEKSTKNLVENEKVKETESSEKFLHEANKTIWWSSDTKDIQSLEHNKGVSLEPWKGVIRRKKVKNK
jgi:hypothetical protein